MVGANTVRIDDPLLTVRPPRHRARPYLPRRRMRERADRENQSRFRPRTRLRPYHRAGAVRPERSLRRVARTADVLYVGEAGALRLDPIAALEALRAREIFSVLCEGGPKLAAALVAAEAVDRFYWAIAPRMLGQRTRRCGSLRQRLDADQPASAFRPDRAPRRRPHDWRVPSNVFSGLIGYRGEVVTFEPLASGGARLELRCEGVDREKPVPKDSIAVDGVCLTATAVNGDLIAFDVVPETLSRSTLGDRARGDRVNCGVLAEAGRPAGRTLRVRSRRCDRARSERARPKARESGCASSCRRRCAR